MLKLWLHTLVLFAISTIVNAQGVVINEVVADNTSGVQDEDGDYSDWIELYNDSPTPMLLNGWWLSDDANDLNKWALPNQELLPHGHITIFASGKYRETSDLHTNFSIDAEGETVLLISPSNQIIDQIQTVELAEDRSFGRLPDGGEWSELITPTWGYTNDQNDAIFCSHNSGYFTESINVELNSVLGSNIYYTLDGSLPTEASAQYTGAIILSNPDEQENVYSEIPTTPDSDDMFYAVWTSPQGKVDKANVLRFAGYKEGGRTTPVTTKTFFIDTDIYSKYKMPVVSLVANPNDLFSDEAGIYVPGNLYIEGEDMSSGNYIQRGREWERDIHFEYLNIDGELEISTYAGARIHGGISRYAAQKSLRLYARDEYGNRSFNYPLIPQKDHQSYKRIVLYSPMSDLGESMLKDVVAGEIVNGLDFEQQGSREVVVFINGEYWGIHIIRERIDKHFLVNEDSTVTPGSIDLVHANSYQPAVEGSFDAFHSLIEFCELNSLSVDHNYDWVLAQIDLNSYLDYMVAEIFLANYDWPGNNNKIWRKNNMEDQWRMIFYDLGWAYNGSDYDMFEHSTRNEEHIEWPNPTSSTELFRSLLENDQFRDKLVLKFQDLLSSTFLRTKTIDKLLSKKSVLAPEMSRHINRWNFPSSYYNWEHAITTDITSFLYDRPCILRSQIIEFFNLSEFGFECEPERVFEGLALGPNPNQGEFSLYNHGISIISGKVVVTNLMGQIVYENPGVEIPVGSYINISLDTSPTGLYFVQISEGNHRKPIKMFLNR